MTLLLNKKTNVIIQKIKFFHIVPEKRILMLSPVHRSYLVPARIF